MTFLAVPSWSQQKGWGVWQPLSPDPIGIVPWLISDTMWLTWLLQIMQCIHEVQTSLSKRCVMHFTAILLKCHRVHVNLTVSGTLAPGRQSNWWDCHHHFSWLMCNRCQPKSSFSFYHDCALYKILLSRVLCNNTSL